MFSYTWNGCSVVNGISVQLNRNLQTIEGSIICKESLDIFQKWLEKYWGTTKQSQYVMETYSLDDIAKLNVTRCIFHGKTDYLKEIKEKVAPKSINIIVEKYKSGDKTDGWIFSFFEWYFKEYMINDMDKNRQLFSQDFPELYETIHYLEYVLKWHE